MKDKVKSGFLFVCASLLLRLMLLLRGIIRFITGGFCLLLIILIISEITDGYKSHIGVVEVIGFIFLFSVSAIIYTYYDQIIVRLADYTDKEIYFS